MVISPAAIVNVPLVTATGAVSGCELIAVPPVADGHIEICVSVALAPSVNLMPAVRVALPLLEFMLKVAG